MLATFVIALREGLEAALIVGIIATFLRKNGQSLKPLWIGVAAAIGLSLLVGFGLHYTEQALPQDRQELMESVIGLVAVYFVTGMVLWMHHHAHQMKSALESEATLAMQRASSWALVSMAFLAILKEGFETSVFLLATFSAAQSALWSAVGSASGLFMASLIGWGIYVGGIRLNLTRFFRITALFLILVAAGLLVTAIHSAHGAGWLNAGQQRIADLSVLVPPGTIQAALISGVFGIPSDPSLIEAVAWGSYIVIVAVLLYLPTRWRRTEPQAIRLRLQFGVTLLLLAALLWGFYPAPAEVQRSYAPLDNAYQQQVGQARLVYPHDGDPQFSMVQPNGKTQSLPLPAEVVTNLRDTAYQEWQSRFQYPLTHEPDTMTLDDVVQISGQRLPVGFSPSQNPGPFDAQWQVNCVVKVATRYGLLSQIRTQAHYLVTLSGGNLMTPRTLTSQIARDDSACNWQTSDAYRQEIEHQVLARLTAEDNRQLWQQIVPGLLLILAGTCLVSAWQRKTRLRTETARATPLGCI